MYKLTIYNTQTNCKSCLYDDAKNIFNIITELKIKNKNEHLKIFLSYHA